MKKIYLLFLALLLRSLTGNGQEYSVSKVIGFVYYKGKALKKGDSVLGLDNLSATTPNAAIRVISPASGSIPITFVHGKKTISGNTEHHSELYELTVGEYIKEYTLSRSTQTKGGESVAFDWFDFFYSYPDSVPGRMLIIESEKIPRKSRKLNYAHPYDLFAMSSGGNGDSVLYQLKVVNDSICFSRSELPIKGVFFLTLYIRDANAGSQGKMLKVTRRTIQAIVLSQQELDDIIKLFMDNIQENYTSPDEARDELYDFLRFNYGKFYEPLISGRIGAGSR